MNKSRIGMDQPAGPASLRVKFTNFSARGSPPSSTQEMKIPVSGMLAHAPPAPTHAEALLNSSTDSICAGLRRAAYFNKGRQPVSDTTHPPRASLPPGVLAGEWMPTAMHLWKDCRRGAGLPTMILSPPLSTCSPASRCADRACISRRGTPATPPGPAPASSARSAPRPAPRSPARP